MEALWSGSIGDWEEPATAVTGASPRRVRRPPQPAPQPEPSVADLLEADAGSGRHRLPVEVIRSPKRRKSSSARIVDGRIVVRVPQWLSRAQEAEHVAALVAKLERQQSSAAVDLPERARVLAARHDLPVPASIRWVANQRQRWGSCTPTTGEIRVSDRIAGFPAWVVDAVVVHELAHLVHAEHSAAFWELANRYPKMERAYGFLIAMQLHGDEVD